MPARARAAQSRDWAAPVPSAHLPRVDLGSADAAHSDPLIGQPWAIKAVDPGVPDEDLEESDGVERLDCAIDAGLSLKFNRLKADRVIQPLRRH